MSNILSISAIELVEKLKSGEVSCVDACKEYIKRIDKFDKDIKAWAFFDKKLFINATDFLNAIFSNDSFFIKNLRKIGIFSINRSKFMKNELMRNAMGLRSFDVILVSSAS